MERPRCTAGVVVVAALTYGVFAYGGIRSPDGELMFRTAEALVVAGDTAVTPLEGWPSFGVARGRDGRSYAMYGPGWPLVAAPFVALGRQWLAWRPPRAGADGLRATVSVARSYYVRGGLRTALEGRPAGEARAHALRRFAAAVDVVLAVAAVALLGGISRRLGVDAGAALLAVAGFAFATPLLPLSATAFSEVLQTLLALAALYAALARPTRGSALAVGLSLGFALCVHVAALLWAPAVATFALLRWRGLAPRAGGGAPAPGLSSLAVWAGSGGLACVAALLAFNAARFAGPFETGRPLGFYAPEWPALGDVLWSAGRGLLLYAPWALVGAASWPALARRLGRGPAGALAVVAALPVVAYAFFRDWHGGFGPGPRYLLVPIALLAVAVGPGVAGLGRAGRRLVAAALGAAGAAQLWVASGEPFLWQHRWKLAFAARGQDVFADDRLYRSFEMSLFAPSFLTDGAAGPALAQWLGASPLVWWACACLLLGSALAAGLWHCERRAGTARRG